MGRKDYGSLSKWLQNLIVRHFLHCTGAPPWVLQFAVRQWLCYANGQKPKLILETQPALSTFQGELGVFGAWSESATEADD